MDIRDIKASASDQEIYELIKRESFILITRDTDFGNILRYPAAPNCGIILLRAYLLSVSEITAVIKDFFSRVTEEQLLGSIAVIQCSSEVELRNLMSHNLVAAGFSLRS